MSRPIVVIPSCTKLIEGHPFDAVGRKYSTAVAEVAECQPLLIPLDASMTDIGAVLEVADAILLSGSPSNVAPEHYGTEETLRPEAADPARDALTLPLIRAAVERFDEIASVPSPAHSALELAIWSSRDLIAPAAREHYGVLVEKYL
jgi:putative glutamine amidotransferase